MTGSMDIEFQEKLVNSWRNEVLPRYGRYHEMGCECGECLGLGGYIEIRQVPKPIIDRIERHNAIMATLRRKTDLPDDDIYPYIPRFQQPESE